MKQYRITTENLPQDSSDDCILPPDDIVHQMKIRQLFGGLGAAERLQQIAVEQQLNKIKPKTTP